ncbi:uncharacterized protein V6R79_015465 [Siganus canaliculatus]
MSSGSEGSSARRRDLHSSFTARATGGSEQCVSLLRDLWEMNRSKGLVYPTGRHFRHRCQSVTTLPGCKTLMRTGADATAAANTRKEHLRRERRADVNSVKAEKRTCMKSSGHPADQKDGR